MAAAFAAAGLAGTSFLRTVNDFDVPMGLIVMPMFLFSGTFFPIEAALPGWLVTDHPVHAALPRHQPHPRPVDRDRGSAGRSGTSLYLVAFFAIGMWIAIHQMERKLIK